MPKTVEIVMTPSQAREFATWLGDRRMVELPPNLARAIHAMHVALKREDSIDVTALASEAARG